MSFCTLDTTNFPLYAVDVLDQNHILVAGGGGAAKTGVPNCMVRSVQGYMHCPVNSKISL